MSKAHTMPLFRMRTAPVEAMRLPDGGTVSTPNGPRRVYAGDWIIVSGEKVAAVYSDHEFRQRFEPLSASASMEWARPF